MSSLKMSIYMGSNTVMICFLSACSTVLKVLISSYHWCFAALIWDDLPHPSMVACPRPGAAGFSHSAAGATTVYVMTDTMMPTIVN
jgi:hypothetical protein